MNTEKTGGAAFPTNQNGQLHHSCTQDGMTLLDYFAAKALPTILQSLHTPYSEEDMHKAARMAYTQSAAMIEERKKYI